MRKRILYGIVLIVAMCVLTGCWDSVELNDRHVVLEMAFDKAEKPKEKIGQADYYEITYTIPNVKNMSGDNSSGDDMKTALTTVSPTIVKSVDDMENRLQNTLTFSQAKAVIFGEELLKDPQLFKNAINSLSRNIEFSRGINVLATQGKASEITTAENYQNPILGLYLMKFFNNAAKGQGNVTQQSLGNMLKEIQNTGVTTLPLIAKAAEDTVEIGGAAIIKDYKFVGWLSQSEVKGMNLIHGYMQGTPIVIEYNGNYLTYTIEDKKIKYEFEENNGFVAKINILLKGTITEGLSAMNDQIFEKEEMQAIQNLLREKINAQIQVAVNKQNNLKVDFLKIVLAMYRQNPNMWKKYHEQGENLENIKLDIVITPQIQNTGIIE